MPVEITEEENPPTMEDNRMPQDSVDPYGLLYRPDPTVKFQHEVPFSNHHGQELSEDPQLMPIKAGFLVPPEDTPVLEGQEPNILGVPIAEGAPLPDGFERDVPVSETANNNYPENNTDTEPDTSAEDDPENDDPFGTNEPEESPAEDGEGNPVVRDPEDPLA